MIKNIATKFNEQTRLLKVSNYHQDLQKLLTQSLDGDKESYEIFLDLLEEKLSYHKKNTNKLHNKF